MGQDSHQSTANLVTDVAICSSSLADPPSACELDPTTWRRLEKDLYLHSSATNRTAWLCVAQAREEALDSNDLVVTDIRAGEPPDPWDASNDDNGSWESRPGGIWLLRAPLGPGGGNGDSPASEPVADIDVLFGADAVDPRPLWTLMESPLPLADAQPEIPAPRLTVRRWREQWGTGSRPDVDGGHPGIDAVPDPDGTHDAGGEGHPRPGARPSPAKVLRAGADGTFRLVQIADTHMVTGAGTCGDALDGDGLPLPALGGADARTAAFVARVLDAERPGLAVFTGDNVHHGVLDTQTALFKAVAPAVARGIPFAAVFGNHDDEGPHALSRAAQMALLQDLPLSLCQPGPEDVDGVGNYYLQVFGHAAPESQKQEQQQQGEIPLATLFLLDSHGGHPDRDYITQRQIDWFTTTSRALRKARDGDGENDDDHGYCTRKNLMSDDSASTACGSHEGRPPHLSVAFMHIPVPEYGDAALAIRGGHKGEPVECPSHNSHFYNALAAEGVVAVGCGHDHVNDYCGLLPRKGRDLSEGGQDKDEEKRRGRDGGEGGEGGEGMTQRVLGEGGGGVGSGEEELKGEGRRGGEVGSVGDGAHGGLGGPWLCYGGCSGFHAYCSYGGKRYYRRARVWEFDLATGGLRIWKRVEYAEGRVDEMVLVRGGELDVDAGLWRVDDRTH